MEEEHVDLVRNDLRGKQQERIGYFKGSGIDFVESWFTTYGSLVWRTERHTAGQCPFHESDILLLKEQ
jgi:hypothetical protein